MNKNIILHAYIIVIGVIIIIDDIIICTVCGDLNILFKLVAVVFSAYAAYSLYGEMKQRG
jgi:hypothetical protein